MLFQSGVVCLEIRGVLDVIQILTEFSSSFCTCISVVCLLRECIEVWFLGGSQIVTGIAKILWWELYMNRLRILKVFYQNLYKFVIWDYETVSF
jgi:hypothetical protein